ncbi:hypothetical protein OGAPHI_005084 [Ogataea philodendri]|uniref:Uncharacterized protein n=1 Tax=Ogataea philodendri TaxID=1378263 RepID=A0A9P8P0N7_9ASCO|nr:uncharacterized protein OGAPHI_005084 [Ogataea philodendri]KAH3663683.1 hypothetical protein OGAPHI_005084 [Ogataea philodendri]
MMMSNSSSSTLSGCTATRMALLCLSPSHSLSTSIGKYPSRFGIQSDVKKAPGMSPLCCCEGTMFFGLGFTGAPKSSRSTRPLFTIPASLDASFKNA